MSDTAPTHPSTDEPLGIGLLRIAGVVYLGLGAVLGGAYVSGATSSLFPTGWITPLVLLATGMLMIARRRFDLVGTLWAGLALAVFLLDLMVYLDGLALGVADPAAFDASVIVVLLGLVPLILRPRFRD